MGVLDWAKKLIEERKKQEQEPVSNVLEFKPVEKKLDNLNDSKYDPKLFRKSK